ncbi:hypothetical protein [Leucobacter sp. M11]|uniref:hypothetical protein n=1 Tax=Leucobacter sp. M11 TaxID=2993565 RepID=UPI002D80579E|nr:hypothetical protein [Leucobacter sp. M11]MEB4614547.1 hypothetical protein [Leucobacter sp. M11]
MSDTPNTPANPEPVAPGPNAAEHLAETAVLSEGAASPQGSPSAAEHPGANDTVPYPAGGFPQQAGPGHPVPPQFPVAPPKAEPRLTGFMKASIILLCAVSLAAIVLLFLGDFEGKAIRLFSTIVLFGVFTLFTAFDTRRGDQQLWYAPVALIGNTYILGLSLIVVWITRYDPFLLGWTIFWKSLFIIVVIRGVIFGAEMLLRFVGDEHSLLGIAAFATCVLATVAAIMFTAPEAVQSFQLRVPDLYWKFAVSFLILTALGLAVTMLLKWTFGAEEREEARLARVERSRQAAAQPAPLGQPAPFAPTPQRPAPGQPAAAQPAPAQPRLSEEPPFGQNPLPIPPPSVSMPTAQRPRPAQQVLLPWPTYPDGSPLPQLPNGQPDFSAAQHQA